MESSTIVRLLASLLLIVICVMAKPTTPKPNQKVTFVAPSKQDLPEAPVEDIGGDKDDGEILETANAIVFRPLFAYRALQGRRRRVYAPRRSYSSYGNDYGYYYG